MRPGDAAIHAVRALGLTLESPDDLSMAHGAMRRAHELTPTDAWIEAAEAFLRSAAGEAGTDG